MVPSVAVSYLVAMAVGLGFMGALGVPEGELITTAGATGWAAGLLVLVIGATPSIVGAHLAWRALRAGGGRSARAALAVNLALVGYLTVVPLAQMILA
jgi:hypothetical protein